MSKNNFSTPAYYKVAGIVSIIFLAASFVVEPVGTIDESVLKGVAMIGTFAFLGLIPEIIKSAKSVKIEHGDTTIEIETKEKKK